MLKYLQCIVARCAGMQNKDKNKNKHKIHSVVKTELRMQRELVLNVHVLVRIAKNMHPYNNRKHAKKHDLKKQKNKKL